jgi:hypothetical protein
MLFHRTRHSTTGMCLHSRAGAPRPLTTERSLSAPMLKLMFKLILYRLAYGSWAEAKKIIELERMNALKVHELRKQEEEDRRRG